MSSGTATASVQYALRDDIAHVTLDAPPLNILSATMMDELTSAVERALGDPSVKAIVLQAVPGSRAFSAGADVGEHRPEQAPMMIAAFSRLFAILGRSELPIVAVVEGAALGAGFELAMMADILLASDRATFGQPEIRLGFFAPVGVALLPRRIGMGRAIEVTCTGRTYSAAEMRELGVVSRVVPVADLARELETTLGDLRRASAAVLRMNVRLARQLSDRPFSEARLEAERVFLEDLMRTEDVREGIASFFEKRTPAWRNR
ncbi:MAG TPA: enoyl-CoA hydratase/isomerase family protein [Gemmatimonadaceae bacterium]|nr:enoyl-CoA hydratase/isomerase family protein [Gemmatimonadaceae bacterium]